MCVQPILGITMIILYNFSRLILGIVALPFLNQVIKKHVSSYS